MASSNGWDVVVNAVLLWRDEVVLLRCGEDEWELPGGWLETDETPESCAARSVEEELGLFATVERLLDVWVDVDGDGPTLVIAYGCSADLPDVMSSTDEQFEVQLFPVDKLSSLGLADQSVEAIRAWHRLLAK